jgi:4'-phosphopantetheinyl transferase
MTPSSLWPVLAENFVLRKDEVHVFRASLDTQQEKRETLQRALSREELLRAARFHFPKDRNHFVTARGLLRTLIGRYLKLDPRVLRFQYGPHGKPSLETGPGKLSLRFNLSHSHGLCLFAFSLEREVGIDVEHIRPSHPDDEGIVRRFFSPEEAAALGALPSALRQKAFFTFWSRKEAYLKARGLGAAKELNSFDVSGDPDELTGIISIKGDQESFRWSLRDLDPGPGYAAALAAEGRDWQLRRWQWED